MTNQVTLNLNPEPRAVRVGDTVSDFKLDTYLPTKKDFGDFSLSANMAAGKWTVLVFYPADFTFVCATEFSSLAELYPQFQKLGAEVVTVSTDTKFTHLAWQEHEGELKGVTYPMGADPTARVSKQFGVYLEDAGVDLRGTFIIDPKGKLVSAEVNFLNLGRNMEELLRKVDANIYLSKAPAEACPAKWKKAGDTTLKPGAHMVGKVSQALGHK
jgi:alkyl hydroperoxide reductase subunit AhpC